MLATGKRMKIDSVADNNARGLITVVRELKIKLQKHYINTVYLPWTKGSKKQNSFLCHSCLNRQKQPNTGFELNSDSS